MANLKKIDVAIGIIQNEQKKIFITQRPEHVSFAGFWEFPGGKIQQNERPRIALERELFEEIRINVKCASLLDVKKERGSDSILCLYFYLVEKWTGEPYGAEGQRGQWVHQSELQTLKFPPANHSIIATWLHD